MFGLDEHVDGIFPGDLYSRTVRGKGTEMSRDNKTGFNPIYALLGSHFIDRT